MINRVVVIGGGVGGLGAALGLARQGCTVTVLERDPAPGTDDLETAFATWERPSVPQARQPHAFSARARNLLLRHAPDVVDSLRARGVKEWNVLHLAPPGMREPEDEQFTGLLVRRLPFELALRRVVEQEPSIELRAQTVVEDLCLAPGARLPTVDGVVLRDGSRLDADLVIDAGGRKSRAGEWLGRRGVTVPAEVQDCNIVYYGRYFRQRRDSTLDRVLLTSTNLGDLGYLMFATFDGDHGSFALLLGAPPWDRDLRPLRHNHVWEAVASSIPALAPWVDPAQAEPITDVQPMAGHQNVLRRFVSGGEPLLLGLLPVGDALCTTNPNQGWGASLALTYAFAAVEAVREHGHDLRALACGYHDAVMPDAEAFYRESAAQDRLRTYRWRGEPAPEHERQDEERQYLLNNGLLPAMRRDMHVLRAVMRRFGLIDPPDAIWRDERAMSVAREVAAWRAANRPPEALGPTRDELLALIAGTQSRVAAGT